MIVSDPTQPFRHFQHARIDDVQVGPRRAITLILTQLLWDGVRGVYTHPKQLRFGGIQQFDLVEQFFKHLSEREVAWVRLSTTQSSNHKQLWIELALERTATTFAFQCQHFTIDDVVSE
jgi:hypothetical protein